MKQIYLNYTVGKGINGFEEQAIFTEDEVDLSRSFVEVEGFISEPRSPRQNLRGKAYRYLDCSSIFRADWINDKEAAAADLAAYKRRKFQIPVTSIICVEDLSYLEV